MNQKCIWANEEEKKTKTKNSKNLLRMIWQLGSMLVDLVLYRANLVSAIIKSIF